MTDVRAVCVVGYPLAGKSEAMSIAEDMMPTFRMGDLMRNRVAEMHSEEMAEDEDFLSQFATEQRAEHGRGVVGKWMAEKIADWTLGCESETETVFIDGVRAKEELDVLSNAVSDFTIIYLDAPFDERVDRLFGRGRGSEADMDSRDEAVEYLRNRERREVSWGLREIIEKTEYDVRVENTGTLEEFHEEMTEMLQEV